MNIFECKKNNRLPKRGIRVKTIIDENACTDGFLVNDNNIKTRKNGVGIFWDYVPGAGGDLWWIKHDDESVGAYCFDEVFKEVTL